MSAGMLDGSRNGVPASSQHDLLLFASPGICAMLALVCRVSWKKHGFYPSYNVYILTEIHDAICTATDSAICV